MTSVRNHPQTSIRESLERVNLGDKRSDLGITVWPLLGPDLETEHYILLDNAIQQGKVEVCESDQATVDSVVVANRSSEPVFALHGQLLRGAKQNRAVNLTGIYAPESENTILVACVEQGRWNTGHSFSDASYVQSAAGRCEKLGSVLSDLEGAGEGRADQGQVWSQQVLKERRLRCESLTHDEIEIQERVVGSSMVEAIAQWPIYDDQIGAIFYANNSWAVEVFDKHSTYVGYHESLLRSFAIEASEARSRSFYPASPNPRKVLDLLWTANLLARSCSGIGELLSEGRTGKSLCALEWSDNCVSLSASGVLSPIRGSSLL